MPNQPSLSQRAKFYWACVSPYNTWLSAGYTLLGVITTIRDELLPEPWKKHRVIELLPSWPWYVWIVLGIALVAIALIEGALRQHHLSEEARSHSKPLIDIYGTPYGSSKKRGVSKFIAPGVIVMILVGVYFIFPRQEVKKEEATSLALRTLLEDEIRDMKYPKFKVNIEKIYTHLLPLMEMKTLGTNIILVVSIENSGADSFAKWQPLTVITSDGRSFTGVLKATSNDTRSSINIGDNIELTWWGVDALYNKTVRNPIKKGGREIGILEYVVVEQEGVLARAGTKLHLTTRDVVGKEHSTDYVWQVPQSKALVCFPGLKMQYENVRTKFIEVCN